MRRPDAARHAMHARRPGRLSGAATRRLLDGGDGPAPLPQILAAASAPTTAAELRGESAACAAFRSSARSSPLPQDEPRRFPVRAASTFTIAKAVAAIALTASTAGGIALATSSTPADPHARSTSEAVASDGARPASLVAAAPGPGAAVVDPGRAADLSTAASPPSDSARTTPRPTPAAGAVRPTGLCRASSTVATDAGCADTDAGTSARPTPSGPPGTAPADPGKSTGKPDTTGRANDRANDRAKGGTAGANKPEKAGKQADDRDPPARNQNGDRGASAGKGDED